MVVSPRRLLQFGYNSETEAIEAKPMDSGNVIISSMLLRKGFPKIVQINVDEISQNKIAGNGERTTET